MVIRSGLGRTGNNYGFGGGQTVSPAEREAVVREVKTALQAHVKGRVDLDIRLSDVRPERLLIHGRKTSGHKVELRLNNIDGMSAEAILSSAKRWLGERFGIQ